MSNEVPFTFYDPQLEQARLIVAHYLDRKYGGVSLTKLERALTEIIRLRRNDVRHPLILANKAIEVAERVGEQSRAA